MISIFSGLSEKAWTSTGTSNPDSLIASTTPLSSPKLGWVMRMPSISSLCALKRAAHFLECSYVSVVPKEVSSGDRAIARIPSDSSRFRICFRPSSAR